MLVPRRQTLPCRTALSHGPAVHGPTHTSRRAVTRQQASWVSGGRNHEEAGPVSPALAGACPDRAPVVLSGRSTP